MSDADLAKSFLADLRKTTVAIRKKQKELNALYTNYDRSQQMLTSCLKAWTRKIFNGENLNT